MNSSRTPLDLDLWLDKSLIQRQNQLKYQFIEVFEEVGNSFSNEELKQFFPSSKGKKITKGNDLEGFPYLVLDLVRDFDLDSGLNIRFLNWFGHGMYLALFFGKNISFPSPLLLENGFHFGLVDKPWDFPELILNKKYTERIAEIEPINSTTFKLWIKEIQVEKEKNELENCLKSEIKKILELNQKS
ncbi:hypothetical protein [Algoriphagus sp. AK58]|uniref:hypothetical protein n=1 Tax=Algoriphagus sp. AK58 TaxID=1406877 RepID=UPI00164F5C74|nr:hypothetical protein [Algoriphagus sp. AK58]MBC6368613.1 hypothetical protein [Algoriphagus sp. AK58]